MSRPAARAGAGLALAAGSSILCFAASILVFANLRLALGAPAWAAVVPLALLSTSAFFVWAALRERPRPRRIACGATYAAVLLAVLGAAALQHRVFDASYDGQNYHAVAILLLLEGWNPLVDDAPVSGREAAPIHHFPKGAWLSAAALARVTGSLEAGKAFTLLLLLASFALVAGAVALRRGRLSRRDAVLALLVAANPVAVKNVFTHMTDGQLAALLACLAAYLLVLRDRRDAAVLAGLVFALVAAVNAKFTGLVFATLVCAGGLAWHAWRGRPWRRPALAAAAGLAVGTGLLGYAPYVRNTLEHGHPFHPMSAQSGAIPSYTPPNLRDRTRAEKLLLSAFSATDARPLAPARPKLPLVVHPREIRSAAAYDTRLGGFGPLFGLELLLLAGVLGHAVATRRAAEADLLVLAGLLLVTSALFPEPWWARWIPQLWAVPLLAVLGLERGGRGGAWLDAALVAVAVLNVGVAAAANGARVVVRNREIHAAHSAVLEMRAPVQVESAFPEIVRARLAELGVPSRATPGVACAEPLPVPASHALICPAPGR